jgi:hypothetical protein
MHHTDYFPAKFGDCAVLVGEGALFASVASGTDLEQRQAWVLRSQRTPDILGQATGGDPEQFGDPVAVVAGLEITSKLITDLPPRGIFYKAKAAGLG